VATNLSEELKKFEKRWTQTFLFPTWYLSVVPEMQQLMRDISREPKVRQRAWKAKLYGFIERQLSSGNIFLGSGTGSVDVERERIDTVVIHHTSNPPGLSPSRLSAIELIRLYAPYFASPRAKEDQHLKGQPIFSGHLRNGRQVFWPYHWIVRRNGSTERLLRDDEIGWHAGNWKVNCQSVAIVLDNDYQYGCPGKKELKAIAYIIASYYRDVSPGRILGHREVASKTTCPSELFLDGKEKGWKTKLLALLETIRVTRKA